MLRTARAMLGVAVAVYRNRDHAGYALLALDPIPTMEQQPGAVEWLEATYAMPAYGEHGWSHYSSEPSDVVEWTEADTLAYWAMLDDADYDRTRPDLDQDESGRDDPNS